MYKFDRNLLIVQQIGSLKDNSKRSLSNLLANPIMHAYNIR